MTEKEKQQRGELYNPAIDPELKAELLQAKELCHQYNNLPPADNVGRQAVLRRLLGHVGERCCIMPPLWCDYGYNIEVGDDFFANYNLTILDGAKVQFGNHVFVGPGCGFHTAQHPIDAQRRNTGQEWAFPITVGDNVWIGAGVQVLPGVSIGHNSVVGAGSVVTRDVPPYTVVAGNPARPIRTIEPESNEKL